MKQFNEPEIIIKQLEVEDIITTSGDVQVFGIMLGENQTPFG